MRRNIIRATMPGTRVLQLGFSRRNLHNTRSASVVAVVREEPVPSVVEVVEEEAACRRRNSSRALRIRILYSTRRTHRMLR